MAHPVVDRKTKLYACDIKEADRGQTDREERSQVLIASWKVSPVGSISTWRPGRLRENLEINGHFKTEKIVTLLVPFGK